jgi:hypothetical protein
MNTTSRWIKTSNEDESNIKNKFIELLKHNKKVITF